MAMLHHPNKYPIALIDIIVSHENRYLSIVTSRLSHKQKSISKMYLFMNILNIHKSSLFDCNTIFRLILT